jgi:CNT family concentrative nucleoside transporter
MLGIAWALSENRQRFPWRIVVWGLALQTLFALLILRTRIGRSIFDGFQEVVTRFTGFANEGNALVFGPLANRSVLEQGLGPGNAFILAITVTGIIIFISAFSSLLYHYGILQWIVRGVAWLMRRAMRTSGSETLAAAANIFMGQTEAPLVIKPYLARMTRSELMALMTGGMATIAGSVLAAYVSFGIEAGHLLTASVLSAPAGLLIAKILVPETETSETSGGTTARVDHETSNGLDALCHGASDGMRLSLNVIAMLIAFTAVIAAVNWMLSAALGIIGLQSQSPLQTVLGWINAPFAFLMGVPWKDCPAIGTVLGERIVLSEFIGYIRLAELGDTISPKSKVIATYALCGFANAPSIAIQIGGISALAPTRRTDLAQLGLKSMIGGLLTCYITACVASLIGG